MMDESTGATEDRAAQMYYVALVLPPEINDPVLQWKQHFRDAFGCKVALKSPAHITLVPPQWIPVSAEPILVNAIDSFCRQQAPFTLATSGFSAFPPRTIFVAVAPSNPLQQLKAALDAALFQYPALRIKKETRLFHPHITLATRDLPKHRFAEAWALFADQEFSVQWQAADMSILRHNGRHWDVLHTAPFGA